MKNRKKIAGVVCLILAAGLFLGLGFAISAAGEFETKALTATGTVVELVTHTTYHPVVEFAAADGITYRFESIHGSRPPDYRVGEQVPVLYDPASPSSTARLQTVMGVGFLAILLGGLGTLFGALGLILTVSPIVARMVDQGLKRRGIRVEATITAVDESPLSGNGATLYRVSAEYLDPQTEMKQFFNSRDVCEKPNVSVGQSITVYIDPSDENKYLVEVPALSKIRSGTVSSSET